MKIFLTIFIAFLFLTAFAQSSNFKVSAETMAETVQAQEISARKLDKRAEILAKYLARFDSPLQFHAQDFLDAAETYNLDWKMLPAIAGVESTFGKQIPGGYNAWGWGVYGTQAIYFNSWREGIFVIAKGLRENYLDKGLTEPYSINRIYAASPFWGAKVAYFMNDLENFAANYESGDNDLSNAQSAPKIAAVSASLAPLPYGTGLVLR